MDEENFLVGEKLRGANVNVVELERELKFSKENSSKVEKQL